jgi:hypothetical protein
MGDVSITEEQVKQILENLYDFKEQVRNAGNSKYIRLSNKDILFALLVKMNKLQEENCNQNKRLTRLESVVYVGIPIIVAVVGLVINTGA